MKRRKRTKSEGNIAKEIRRQMIQKNHGDDKFYSRKSKKIREIMKESFCTEI